MLSKRGSVDGGEYLTIPLDRFANINHTVLFFLICFFFRPTLQAFLENIEESWDGALQNKDILDHVRRVTAGPFSIGRPDLRLTINFLILFWILNSPIAGGILKDPFRLRSIYSKPFWKVIKLAFYIQVPETTHARLDLMCDNYLLLRLLHQLWFLQNGSQQNCKNKKYSLQSVSFFWPPAIYHVSPLAVHWTDVNRCMMQRTPILY